LAVLLFVIKTGLGFREFKRLHVVVVLNIYRNNWRYY